MLLFRSSRLSHCLQFRTNNTEPTLYVYTMMYLYANARVQYIHTMGVRVAMFWNLCELARFRWAKTKRVRRFLSICQVLPIGKTLQNYNKKLEYASILRKNENFYAESRKRGLYGDKNVTKMHDEWPRIQFLSHKGTIISGNGRRWAPCGKERGGREIEGEAN